MKYISRFLLAVLFIGFYVPSNAQSSCVGTYFEGGSTAGWSFFIDSAGATLPGTATPGPLPGRHDITSGPGTDPYAPSIPIVAPDGGAFSLKLGNNSLGQSERASYVFSVPAGTDRYTLLYKYAVVLEEPDWSVLGTPPPVVISHNLMESPKFTVTATDLNTGAVVTCSSYSYSQYNAPGFVRNTTLSGPVGGFDVFYKNWETATVDIGGHEGHNIRVDFVTSDCTKGGHFAYAYIDLACILFPTEINRCATGTPELLHAPAGYMGYTWYNTTDFSTPLSTSQVFNAPTPALPVPGTITYAVVLTPFPGYGCPETLSVAINLIPVPNVGAITPTGPICVPAIVDFDNTGTPGGIWTSSLGTIDPATGVIGFGSVSGPTTVTIGYALSNACGSDANSINVLLNPAPVATAVRLSTGCDPVCPGQPVYIKICGTAGATVGYSWVDPGGISFSGIVTLPATPSTACTTLTFTGSAEGLAIFNLISVHDINCTTNLNKSIPATISYPHCDMSIVDLSGSPGSPYTYMPCDGDPYKVRIYGYPGVYHISGPSLPPGFTATIPTGATYVDIGPYVLPTGTPSYSYVITQIDGCCTKVMSNDQYLCGVNVLTRGRPNVSLSAPDKICPWNLFTLSATTGWYAWSAIQTVYWTGPALQDPLSGATVTSLVDAPPVLLPPPPPPLPIPTLGTVVHTGGPLGAGVYPYSITSVTYPYTETIPGYPPYTMPGCSAATSIMVTVNPDPGPLAGPSAICLGETVTYTDLGLPALSGVWSSSIPGILTIDPISGSASGIHPGTVTITYTLPTGCYATKTVTVVPPGQTDPAIIKCGVGTVVVLTNPIPGGTWTSLTPLIATVDASGMVTGIAVGTALIDYTAPSGCSFLTLVTVPPGPIMPMPVVTCWVTIPTAPPYTWYFGFNTATSGVSITGSYIIIDMSPSPPPPGYFFLPFSTVLPGGSTTMPPPPAPYLPPTYFVSGIRLETVSYDGCTWKDSCAATISRPAGHEDDNTISVNTRLSVTPNPNNGMFTLSGSLPGLQTAKEVRIEVIDMLGKTLFTEVVAPENGGINKKFNMGDNVANGVYFLKVKTEDQSQVIRFTLER